MSTFFIVLIVFIIVIALLCLVSCMMYFCHICDNGEPTEDKRFSFISRKKTYDPAEQELLNQRQTSPPPLENHQRGGVVQIEMVNVKERAHNYETQEKSWRGEVVTPPLNHSQVRFPSKSTPVSRKTSRDNNVPSSSTPFGVNLRPVSPEKCSASSEDISIKKKLHKPALATRPMIHSCPSSKRNSLVRPTDAPPPPPAFVQPLQVQAIPQKKSSIVKPKAPPPPFPAAQNPPPFSGAQNSPTSPPPGYNEIVYDTPDDYLSNN